MNTQETNDQHYVPRFYLKGFSSEEQQSSLHTFRTSDKKYLGCKGVKGIAYLYRFYGEDIGNSLENRLHRKENIFAPVHHLLLEGRTFSELPDEHKRTYAEFIALQHERTAKRRAFNSLILEIGAISGTTSDIGLGEVSSESLKEKLRKVETVLSVSLDHPPINITDEQKPEFRRFIKRKLTDIDKVKAKISRGKLTHESASAIRETASDSDKLKDLHNSTLEQASQQTLAHLLKMHWQLQINTSKEVLMTSDHPVILFDTKTVDSQEEQAAVTLGYVDWTENTNLKSSLVVVFPVSPRLVLKITSQKVGGSSEILSQQEVRKLNIAIAAQAQEYVYSSSNDFRVAKKGVDKAKKAQASMERLLRTMERFSNNQSS